MSRRWKIWIGAGYLNTYHVKVQCNSSLYDLLSHRYLNTYYVKVQLLFLKSKSLILKYLNTYHVKVQYGLDLNLRK